MADRRLALPPLLVAALVATSCGPDEPRPADCDGSQVIVSFHRQLHVPRLERLGRFDRRRLVGSLRDEATSSQGRALAVLRRHGVEPSVRLWAVNALVVCASPDALADLAALPEVESIRPDLELARPRPPPPSVASVSSLHAPRWNLELIGAPALWAEGHTGEGVLVAGLDTGVDPLHPALAGSFRGPGGWYDPYGQRPTPADADGHGTQTMGLMAGSRGIGVAPGARWMAARIYDDAGKASLSAIHQALQWVLDPDGDPQTDDLPDVVNGSWGFDELAGKCFLEFEPDLAALRAAGTAVVFSAGNSGPGAASSTSPANNPSALAVGGIDQASALQQSSSRGPGPCGAAPFPTLVAPGVDVRTTDRTFGGLVPDSYALVSGTSFAAPHVAGAMALLRGARPDATAGEVEQALTDTAVDLGSAGADSGFGYGRIDLVAARARLDELIAGR